MSTLAAAIVCLCIGFLIGRSRQGVPENQGEAAVRRLLSQRFVGADYHLLNNVTLPADDGTTQVDHVLISRRGIFVIETKHYKGWLFANASSAQWTQVLHGKHYRFQNPLHQNCKHVRAVEKLLDFLPPQHIHSLVVFTGDAVFKTPRAEGVVTSSELVERLEGFSDEVLSLNRMQFCVGRLECCRLALTRQTDVEHVAYLRRKFGEP